MLNFIQTRQVQRYQTLNFHNFPEIICSIICLFIFVRSSIYNHICVVGKKETIYPLVQTVNALYLQLLEMQKAFTSTSTTPDTLPASDEIKELQTEYTNMLTAIIDLLDGAQQTHACVYRAFIKLIHNVLTVHFQQA